MKQFIEKIKKKENLTFDESKSAFELLMEGKAEEQEIFDFLTLLSAKGESSDEVAGGVFVLRNKSKRVNVENCVDTCGTGGDGMNTFNISTASEGAYCGIFFEEQNKKLSEIFVNAIQNSNMQRILWISKKEPRNNILEIDNLTYIKHSSENDYFNTVLSLEEVEEVNEKFIDLK